MLSAGFSTGEAGEDPTRGTAFSAPAIAFPMRFPVSSSFGFCCPRCRFASKFYFPFFARFFVFVFIVIFKIQTKNQVNRNCGAVSVFTFMEAKLLKHKMAEDSPFIPPTNSIITCEYMSMKVP